MQGNIPEVEEEAPAPAVSAASNLWPTCTDNRLLPTPLRLSVTTPLLQVSIADGQAAPAPAAPSTPAGGAESAPAQPAAPAPSAPAPQNAGSADNLFAVSLVSSPYPTNADIRPPKQPVS